MVRSKVVLLKREIKLVVSVTNCQTSL